ncbi:ABC transporter substrate-binding protein [Ramlibacter sp.]|uniref:ABC transporter substrate-binding protein n=1 Tax=Ramlibacter sp. TaxID=1917967 RepID=UPI003D11BA32
MTTWVDGLRHALAAALVAGAFAPAYAQTPGVNKEGVGKDRILLGTSNPLTGPVGPPCKPVSDGHLAWFAHVNAQGGVKGRKIENIVLDDAYKAPEALANGRQLAAKPVFAFFAGCGTLQPPVLMPIARQNKMLYLFPSAGNPELMTTHFVYSLFPLYSDQMAAITEASMKKYGPGKVFSVLADVPGVEDNIKAIVKAATSGGGSYIGEERVTQREPDYTPLALKIKAMKPDYIMILMTAPATAKLMNALQAQDAFPAKYLLGTLTMASPAFLNAAGSLVNGKALVGLPVVPPDDPRAKSCVDVLKKYSPETPIDAFSLYGCAAGQVFSAALADTPEPVTRASFEKTLMSWKAKNVTEVVSPITFNNPKHLGATQMIMTKIVNGKAVAEGTIPLPR